MIAYASNNPDGKVGIAIEITGKAYEALLRLIYFYTESETDIVSRLLIEKAAELGLKE